MDQSDIVAPSPEIEALEEAVQVVGGVGTLATALGVVQGAVSNWKKRGRVPAEHCPGIERETTSRGKPVPCERLRPDVDWAYLRQSAPQPAEASHG